MSKSGTLVLVFLLLAATLPSPMVSAADEPPLADAGLDQQVTRGATVLLDGTGSRDPDGTIESFRWSVRAPDGSTVTLARPEEPQTQFQPSQVGTYTVTLTVTDDDGQTSTDTLFVTVSPGQRPDVSVYGSQQPTVGESVTYSAAIDAGAADLAYVVWRIDDDRVANHSLSGTSAVDSIDRSFPLSGDKTVSATVYDVDGQRRTDSLSISVEDAPSDPPGDPGRIASRASPTVRGPALVTGETPLVGSYRLDFDIDRSEIDRVSWRSLSGSYGTSLSESITWVPGDHSLFALVTYEDGSQDVATFPGGSTTVIADPKPALALGDITGQGSISGTPIATDGYGNLQRLTIDVNGTTVATKTIDPTRLQKPDVGARLERAFEYRDFTPGEPYNVTVTATDARGQTTTKSKVVEPVGKPEVVRSEFVNDPVDSYHERIDPSRYAAHHVLEIKLNGVEPETIGVEYLPRQDGLRQLATNNYQVMREYNTNSGSLTIHSYWAGNIPRTENYTVKSMWFVDGTGSTNYWEEVHKSSFKVGKSKPELRYSVVSGGTSSQENNWGIKVDASSSFDPDGTKLNYIWKEGAEPIVPDNTTAKFSSLDRAVLTIRDYYKLTTTESFGFLDYFNPGVQIVTPVTNEPYRPNETVNIRVISEPYKLTKNRYSIDIGIRTEDIDSSVTRWEKIKMQNGECIAGNCSLGGVIGNYTTFDDDKTYYTGVVEVEASELADGRANPKIVMYNEDAPEETTVEHALPEVNVLTKGSKVWHNVTISDLEYLVERPLINIVTTQNEEQRDHYLADGYEIESIEKGTEYTIEELVQVQEAEYETRTKVFRGNGYREIFLDSNPDWKAAGTTTETRTWTRTETEWRDSKGGDGTYTGNTRRVQTDPPEYRTKKKYEYEYQVPRTGTRTVTRCNVFLGCYEVTETYSYYVTKTKTYWAFGKYDYSHEFTGETKRVQISPAEFTTQYEYEYEVEYEETEWYYRATTTVKTQDAKFEWQVYETTTDRSKAKQLTKLSEQYRIGDTSSTPRWTLEKQVGNYTDVVSSFDDEKYVVETQANVSGDVMQRYLNMKTGEVVLEHLKESSEQFISKGAMTENEIVSEYEEAGENSDDPNWCRLKSKC